MRLDLPGGQWAELRERLTHGQAVPIRALIVRFKQGDWAAGADIDLAIVRGYVSAWNVLDADGHAVSLDTPDLAPDDVITEIGKHGMLLWKAAQRVPKAGRKPSPSPPRELRSA